MGLTKLNNQSLSAVTSAGLPNTLASQLPTGSVVQVVRTYSPSEVPAIATSSTNWTASGIIASITPTKSGNLILIDMCLPMVDCATDTINIQMYQKIANGSYAVMTGANGYQAGIQSGSRWHPNVFSGTYTATSTSQLSYQPYYKSSGGAEVRIVHDSSSYALTLTEIAA